MPFPKDLKAKHLERLFLCQLEQFIYLLKKHLFLIGQDIILKNIYLTILPKNYFLEANIESEPMDQTMSRLIQSCTFSLNDIHERIIPFRQNRPHSFWRWFFSLDR